MIIHGKALLWDRIENVYIKIDDGWITDISKQAPTGEVIEFDKPGMVILPGMIDLHVHMRDFEQSYKEDFYTGTLSAAAGGVCIVVDMPNTRPRNNRLEVLRRREAVASSKAIVDYGLYYGVPESLDELEGYEELAVGMKIYPQDYDNPHLSDILRYNAKKNILTVVHPEDPSDMSRGVRSLSSEYKAISMFREKAVKLGLRLHLTHLTSVNSIFLAQTGEGNVTTDTCPHYLLLNSDQHKGIYYKVHPPLRPKDIQESLLENIKQCPLDAISTDHAPHTIDEKMGHDGKGGFPGLETALPILMTLYRRALLTLWDVARLYSYKPAAILGLDDILGTIEPGKLANLVVYDMDGEYPVDPSGFKTKAKHSPFDGMKVVGRVYCTIVRGRFVYIDGEAHVKNGYGVNIKNLLGARPKPVSTGD